MASTSTMALFTTIPASITEPISASTLIGFPVTSNADTTPMIPRGTEIRMTKG